MRSVTALCLSLLLVSPGYSNEPSSTPESIKQRASRMKPGKNLVVVLHDKEKVRGVLLAVEENALRLDTSAGQGESERVIPYDRIRDMSLQTARWVKVAAVAGAVAVVGLVILGMYASSV